MKTNPIFALIPVLAAAFAGCGPVAAGDGFSRPEKLAADSVAVNQIIRPARWAVSFGKAVVQSDMTDSLFYVYSLPDFRFLYTWGRRGEGPGEFAAVTVVNARDGDTGALMLEDYRRKSIRAFAVGDSSFIPQDILPTFPDEKAFTDDRPLPGGFLGTKKLPAGSPREYFYIRSRQDGAVLDSVPLWTYVEAKYTDQGNMYSLSRLNTPKVIVRDDRIALVYEMFRHIDFYRVSPQGRLTLEKAVGEEIDEAAIERMVAARRASSQKGVVGFAATQDYLYTLYLEFEVLDWENKRGDIRKKTVYVYDWDGREVRAYELERPATDILVTADGKTLFAYNALEDFDRVYRYDLENNL